MKPNELIVIQVCCNDEQTGHFLGYLTGFSIENMDIVCIAQDESPEFLFDGNYLRIGKNQFYVAERKHYAGHPAWETVWMPAKSVCGLLNWARSNEFFPEDTPESIEGVWDSGEKFQPHHLELLF